MTLGTIVGSVAHVYGQRMSLDPGQTCGQPKDGARDMVLLVQLNKTYALYMTNFISPAPVFRAFATQSSLLPVP